MVMLDGLTGGVGAYHSRAIRVSTRRRPSKRRRPGLIRGRERPRAWAEEFEVVRDGQLGGRRDAGQLGLGKPCLLRIRGERREVERENGRCLGATGVN